VICAIRISLMNITRQIKLPAALGLWVAVCLAAAFAGNWMGLGGRSFAVALAAFAALFAVEVLLTAQGVAARLAALPRGFRSAMPLLPLLVYVFYAAGGGVFYAAGGGGWVQISLAALYVFAPAALLEGVEGRPHGCWNDYAALLCIWLPAEFHFLQRLFPYPAARLSHPLWAAFAMTVALIAFLLVRRLDGVGYTVAWGRGWSFIIGLNFILFMTVAIPLGRAIGFIIFRPQLARVQALPLVALGVLLFTAWPEEFLFRGLIQNLLAKNLGSELLGLLAAAAIFGLAHLNNGSFPNWRYAALATLAGLAYGQTWRKTGSIFASTIVHTLVNVTWYALFRTM
jgi:membrane protease YdiL (CAAX protease family)